MYDVLLREIMSEFQLDLLPAETIELIHQLSDNLQRNQSVLSSLNQLWELASRKYHKLALCHPSFQLLPLFIQCLRLYEDDMTILQPLTGCIWYISRDNDARLFLCSPTLQLVPILLNLMGRQPQIRVHIAKALSNCSLTSQTHGYLLRPEFGYLLELRQHMTNEPNHFLAYQQFFCVTSQMSCLTPEHFLQVIQTGVFEHIMNKLMLFGANPPSWNMDGWTPYWCFNFITVFSRFALGRQALAQLSPHKMALFEHLLKESRETVIAGKAAIILANTSQACGDISLIRDLLNKYPHIFPILNRMYRATFYCNAKDISSLRGSGFAYGIIKLQDLSSGLAALASCEKNKTILLNTDFLSLICDTLKAFVNDEPQRKWQETYTIDVGGGGGADYDTAANCLNLLQQLFLFNEEQFRYCMFQNDYSLTSLLQDILNLPKSREIPFHIQQQTSLLLKSLLDPF